MIALAMPGLFLIGFVSFCNQRSKQEDIISILHIIGIVRELDNWRIDKLARFQSLIGINRLCKYL